MNSFEDRSKNFENKFKHDEEFNFKAQSRAAKLLGLWVAELLGKVGPDAEAYAKSCVMADMDEPGIADLLGKVGADLTAAGKPQAEIALQTKYEHCLKEAKAQLQAGN